MALQCGGRVPVGGCGLFLCLAQYDQKVKQAHRSNYTYENLHCEALQHQLQRMLIHKKKVLYKKETIIYNAAWSNSASKKRNQSCLSTLKKFTHTTTLILH
jgi:hypothetical protein